MISYHKTLPSGSTDYVPVIKSFLEIHNNTEETLRSTLTVGEVGLKKMIFRIEEVRTQYSKRKTGKS